MTTKDKGAYGTVHALEEEMRAAEVGVFEPKSGEAGRVALKRRAKAASEPKPKAKA